MGLELHKRSLFPTIEGTQGTACREVAPISHFDLLIYETFSQTRR